MPFPSLREEGPKTYGDRAQRQRERHKNALTQRQKFRDAEDAEQPSENTQHHKKMNRATGKMKPNSLAGMRDRD